MGKKVGIPSVKGALEIFGSSSELVFFTTKAAKRFTKKEEGEISSRARSQANGGHKAGCKHVSDKRNLPFLFPLLCWRGLLTRREWCIDHFNWHDEVKYVLARAET